MGTPHTSRPRRARLSATAAALAGLAVLAPACGFGGGSQHNSSQAAQLRGTGAAVAAVPQAALTGPGAGSWGNGRLDLFYRNSRNGQLAHQRYVPGGLATWTAAESLGGTLTSQPAVTSWAAGRYDVFARGSDNAIWHKTLSGGTWSAWQSLGQVASSAPAAAAWGNGRLDVFVRGTNNQLYTRHYTTSAGWSGWSSLGGILTSGPAVASWGPGRLDVFVRGGDKAVWHKWFSGGKWSGWQSLGGVITGEPGAASTGPGKLDLFARSTSNALLGRNYYVTQAGWSSWSSLSGTGAFASSPSATVPAAGVMTVFARNANGSYYYRQRSAANGWSGWQFADAALAFRGLGAWVGVFDYAVLDPVAAVADMKARGVRTLYLATARYNSAADILYPAQVDAWLAAAHAAGIRVTGWYVPDYADLARDVRRTLAIADYVSPAGQRFDAIGLDIEYPLAPPDANAWNRAVADQLGQVRARTVLPLTAIVLPPAFMRLYPDRWATFPWTTLTAAANAIAPMDYWTSFTAARNCAAGDARYCAYQYTRDNVLLSRQYTGLPVHVIGGSGDAKTMTAAQVADFVRAAGETAAAGGSFFSYRYTTPEFWPYLQRLNP